VVEFADRLAESVLDGGNRPAALGYLTHELAGEPTSASRVDGDA
jgi:hypothetical protein